MESREQIEATLKKHGQDQVLRFWDDINEEGRRQLLAQIANLDLTALRAVFTAEEVEMNPELITPYTPTTERSNAVMANAPRSCERNL